jgi:hypothetical protein
MNDQEFQEISSEVAATAQAGISAMQDVCPSGYVIAVASYEILIECLRHMEPDFVAGFMAKACRDISGVLMDMVEPHEVPAMMSKWGVGAMVVEKKEGSNER